MLALLLKRQLFGPPDTYVQVGDYTIDFGLFPVKSFDDFVLISDIDPLHIIAFISKTTKNFLPFWAFPLADRLTSCSQVCRFPKCQDSEAMWGLQLGA
jgi:hypothetical protein